MDVYGTQKWDFKNTQQKLRWEQSHVPNLGNAWVFLGIF